MRYTSSIIPGISKGEAFLNAAPLASWRSAPLYAGCDLGFPAENSVELRLKRREKLWRGGEAQAPAQAYPSSGFSLFKNNQSGTILMCVGAAAAAGAFSHFPTSESASYP